MARIKKTSPLLNLTNFQTFIIDDNPLSQYFRISELSDLLTAGKNGFLLEGSTFLKPSTEIKIEILDAEGNPIYVEPGEGIPEYYEGLSKLISVHIYEDTPIGIGKITILGELDTYLDENGFPQPIPEDWRGIYNIKWEREIKINKNIPNETRVRFYRRPSVIIEEVDEILYSRDIINGNQTNGSVRGVAITPSEGTYFPTYRGGVRYLIENTTADFKDGGQKISITGTSIQDADIIEYINQRSVIIQTPYVDSSGYVSNLTGSSYSLAYQHTDNPVASSILGSFGRFEINNLATFVGDVERIKVFRKSRSSNLDYQVIQDTRIDSSELITAIISGSSERVGYFSSSYAGGTSWDAYWNTNGGSTTLDSSKIYKGVKLQNSTLSTDLGNDIRLESGSEYTLEFYNYYDTSSNNSDDYLKVYLTSTLQSGSGIANYYLTQSLTTLTGSNQYRSANKIIYNFTPPITDNWTVNFKSVNSTSYWHVGGVSLKASHELGFSPDEFTFSIPIDRSLERETFDFKFEFFDINNNYIPLTTTAAQTFQSGNINVIDKDIAVDLDKQFFNFSSSLEGIPSEQQINISITKNRILGNLLITSQAFDTGGFEIPTGSNSFNPYYAAGVPYPGALSSSYYEDVYSADGHVKLEAFTGSLHNHPTQSSDVIVDRITYTLTETESSQPFVKRFTISRLVAGASGQDGTDSKGLFVSSNTNQFIYEPTGPSLKPSGQTILIQAKRSNLGYPHGPLTINSASSAPALSLVGTVDGVDTFSLNGASYPFSLGEINYSFTGSDTLGVEYSDFVKITPVMNFDGISVVLSNESATFPATSTGTVSSGDLDGGDGRVFVRVGSNEIVHNDGLSTGNRFDIVQITASGCTANETSPTTNAYGISAMSSDSASLDMLIRYKAGDNSTTVDFRKIVSYTKAKKSAPVLEISSTPNAQSVSAKSTGAQIDAFSNVSVVVKETYNGSTTNKTIAGLTATSTDIASISTNAGAGTITLAGKTLADATNSTVVNVTAVVTDSEGSSRTLTDTITLAKVKKAQPTITFSVTPQAQTVAANSAGTLTGTIVDPILSAFEGSNALTYNQGTLTTSQYKITNVTGVTVASTTPSTSTIDVTSVASDDNTGIISISYVDSEGTAGTSTIKFLISKAKTGEKGDQGDAGDPGADGDDGRRTATGLLYYQLSAASAPPTPSATSYTFSTNTFSGLTANWALGAPTFAAGNSNKYWYSTYTAVENTAGGDTATPPTFSAVTQAIGFSGLVTFTSANNISDGTNTSNIVEPGSVTNHIGGANVTTINGGKVSTGVITSTGYSLASGETLANGGYTLAGTIINLDNGSLRSKNFFISSSGDAFFKGNLAAAGGTFTGQLVAASGDFSGTVTSTAGNIGGWQIGNSQINDTANKMKLVSSRPAMEIYTGNTLSVDISAATSLTSIVSGNSVVSNVPYTTTSTVSVISYMDSLQNEANQNDDPSNDPRYSTGGTIATFVPDQTAIYGAAITLGGTQANALGMLEPNGTSPSPAFQYLYATHIIGVSIRTGGPNGTEVANLSTFVNWSRVLSGTNFNQSSAEARVLTGNISVTSGTTYYLVPYIQDGLISSLVSNGNFDTNYLNVDYRTPTITAASISKGISKSELVAGGFQVVFGTDRYIKVERADNANFVSIGGGLICTGDVTANTASDRRWKEQITPIQNPLEKIKKISGNTFIWKRGFENLHANEGLDYGVVAQEIEDVMPEIVVNRDHGFKGVRYEKIIPLLIEAIKEQQKQIDELKRNK